MAWGRNFCRGSFVAVTDVLMKYASSWVSRGDDFWIVTDIIEGRTAYETSETVHKLIWCDLPVDVNLKFQPALTFLFNFL